MTTLIQTGKRPLRVVLPQSVSIIIPTRNRPSDLTETVRTVLAQTVLPREVIIIDQSKTDEGRDLLERLYSEAAEYVRQCTKLAYISDSTITGLTTARNKGMDMAQGEVILFLDDDVLLETNFVDELLKIYDEHPEAIGVSGIITNYTPPSLGYRLWSSLFMRGPLNDDRQPVYWAASTLRRQTPVRITRFTGCMMSFRAKAIEGVRFDENLRGVSDGEDVDFCVRLGPDAALFIAPAARLVHNQSPHGREQGHWLCRHARGTVYLYRRNWSRGLWNRACIMWLNVGYALVATFASSYRLSIQPWRALLVGRWEGLSAAGAVPGRQTARAAHTDGGIGDDADKSTRDQK